MGKFLHAVLLTAFLVASCQTTPMPPFSVQATHTGKFQWKNASHSIAGDIIVQNGSDESLRIILMKEVGTPLLVITRTKESLDVDDRFGKRHWRGTPSHPPSSLIGWGGLMEALMAAPHMPEGVNEVHNAAGWNAVYSVENGRLKEITMISEVSGDHYRVVF